MFSASLYAGSFWSAASIVLLSALALLLVGGERRVLQGGHARRGDVYCLLAGGPPGARAALLRAAATVAAPHVVSTHARAAGGLCTVASLTEGWQAGALVLASGGLACVDGFEEAADGDRISMREMMTEQCVSIQLPGTGFVDSARARFALLAAAGASGGGAYDPRRAVADNTALPEWLLAFFDLLCVLDDHDAAADGAAAASAPGDEHPAPPLDAPLLRAYFAVARAHAPLWPLDDDTVQHIIQRYTALRQRAKAQQLDPATRAALPPVTARTLETVLRLAEAHARLRLADRVAPADVDAALEVMHAAAASGGRFAGDAAPAAA